MDKILPSLFMYCAEYIFPTPDIMYKAQLSLTVAYLFTNCMMQVVFFDVVKHSWLHKLKITPKIKRTNKTWKNLLKHKQRWDAKIFHGI